MQTGISTAVPRSSSASCDRLGSSTTSVKIYDLFLKRTLPKFFCYPFLF